MDKIEKIIPKLKRVLRDEQELQKEASELREKRQRLTKKKQEIAEIFKDEMQTDTYSNSFVTAIKSKKYEIEIVNEDAAKDFFVEEQKLDKKAVEKYYEMIGKVPGLKVRQVTKITFRKKKGGFD